MPAWRTKNSGKENFWQVLKQLVDGARRGHTGEKGQLQTADKEEHGMADALSQREKRWSYRMQVLWTGHGLAQLPERPIYVLEVWAQVWNTETEYWSRTSKKVTVSEEHHSQQALLLAFGVLSSEQQIITNRDHSMYCVPSTCGDYLFYAVM